MEQKGLNCLRMSELEGIHNTSKGNPDCGQKPANSGTFLWLGLFTTQTSRLP